MLVTPKGGPYFRGLRRRVPDFIRLPIRVLKVTGLGFRVYRRM